MVVQVYPVGWEGQGSGALSSGCLPGQMAQNTNWSPPRGTVKYAKAGGKAMGNPSYGDYACPGVRGPEAGKALVCWTIAGLAVGGDPRAEVPLTAEPAPRAVLLQDMG
jgi:hypothetical protein